MRVAGGWDPAEKAAARKIAGMVIAVLAFMTLFSMISYLFHWREDMSLLTDPSCMDASVQVANKGGKAGSFIGHLLVGTLFGLGSFAIPFILFAAAARLLVTKWRCPLLRMTLIAVSGAFVASFVLSYAGLFLSEQTAFGGGLGGGVGSFCVEWFVNLTGMAVTGLVIAVLVVIWVFFSSPRFAAWFVSLGESGEVKAEKEESVAAEETVPVQEIEPEPEHETASETAVGPVDAGVSTQQEEKQGGEEGGFEVEKAGELSTEIREPLKPIDNRMDPPDGLPKFEPLPLDILKSYSSLKKEVPTAELERNNKKIRAVLSNFKIQITDLKAKVGPTVTLYKVFPAPGVRIQEFKRLQEDIAISLNAKGVRVVTLSDSVGIEVANDNPSTVPLRALLNDDEFRNSKAELPVAIGCTITSQVKVFDLANAPHLLVAGATQQGKSVGLNVIVSSLLYSKHPSELKFVFIDPKMVEFSTYKGLIHHYLAVLPDSADASEEESNAIVKTPKAAEKILRSLCAEMDSRYQLMSKAGVNKLTVYNDKYKIHKLPPTEGHRFLPYIVCVIDEYADLTMTTGASPETKAASKSITYSVIRLAQKGRAAGIHVILATQRPSVDVISGVIKTNFPMRIAFRVAAKVDSQTILDSPGAEKLIGRGDMLYFAGIETERIQCGLVEGDEIEKITKFIGNQTGYGRSYSTPYYLPDVSDNQGDGSSGAGGGSMDELDERFAEAAELVVTTQKASTSYLQTRMGMGFAKSARVMSQLEQAGIIGPPDGSKLRQVLVPDLDSLHVILNSLGR